jgi:hypothetical protein
MAAGCRPSWRGAADFNTGDLSVPHTELLMEKMIQQFEKQEMFSLLPWQLATAGLSETIPEFHTTS